MRRIRPEDILKMKWVSDPQISPDGQRVLFTIKQATGPDAYGSHIYLAQEGKYRNLLLEPVEIQTLDGLHQETQ